jgi:hypothetical protein
MSGKTLLANGNLRLLIQALFIAFAAGGLYVKVDALYDKLAAVDSRLGQIENALISKGLAP